MLPISQFLSLQNGMILIIKVKFSNLEMDKTQITSFVAIKIIPIILHALIEREEVAVYYQGELRIYYY